MKTYNEFLLAEGRQARKRAERKAARDAEKAKTGPGVKNPGNRPPNMGGTSEKAGVRRKGGPLAIRPRPTTRKERLGGRRQVGQARTRGIIDKTLQQRKSGFMGGVKSALGGDVIGMRKREGDTLVMDKRRQQMNQAARKEAGKKVGDAAKKELRSVFKLPQQKEVGVSSGGGITGPKTRSSGGGAQ